MKLLVPWIATMQCGDRSSKNQRSVVSTNSQSITRIIDRDSDSDGDFRDEMDDVVSQMNPINKFVQKNMKKGNMEQRPLLSGWRQAGEESGGSASDRQNRLSSSDDDDMKYFNESYGSVGNDQFANIVNDAIYAIREKVYPERIRQGSSGSYFVKNSNGKTVGVFKPKNEEPYGQLNPRWMKWIHRIFFPCCFGRSCLLPNQIMALLFEKFMN